MYLLDTDIIIYSIKNNKNVINNLVRNSDAPKAISVITYGELIFGARKSQYIHENLAKVYRIKDLFPVINVNPSIMETYGELKVDLQDQGVVVSDLDLMIGATALHLGYGVVTNNTRHFKKIPGLHVENWISSQVR